ncbi:MAG TPA: hypothetical protein VGG45_19965 [Terracidiphilus sp.]|jgi:hypothetical protein
MATQQFEAAHLSAAQPFPAVPSSQSYAAKFGGSQAVASRIVLPSQPDWHPDGAVDLRLLGKGVSWALGIEGITALGLYTAWFFWHLRP